MKNWTNLLQAFNTIVLIGAVVSTVGGAFIYYDEITNLIATKQFHNEDSDERQSLLISEVEKQLEPIKQSANAAESNGLPPRIQNLLKVRCASPAMFDQSLQDLLSKLMDRYEELNARVYRVGECRDGVYYNALGVRVE